MYILFRYNLQLPIFQPFMDGLRQFYIPPPLLHHSQLPSEKLPTDHSRPILQGLQAHSLLSPPGVTAGFSYHPPDPSIWSVETFGLSKSPPTDSLSFPRFPAHPSETSLLSRLSSIELLRGSKVTLPTTVSPLTSPQQPGILPVVERENPSTPTIISSASTVSASPTSISPTTIRSPLPSYPLAGSSGINGKLPVFPRDSFYHSLSDQEVEALRLSDYRFQNNEYLYNINCKQSVRERSIDRNSSPASSPKIEVDISRESSPLRDLEAETEDSLKPYNLSIFDNKNNQTEINEEKEDINVKEDKKQKEEVKEMENRESESSSPTVPKPVFSCPMPKFHPSLFHTYIPASVLQPVISEDISK